LQKLDGFAAEGIPLKVDLIYENLGLLNQWVSKIDVLHKRGEELDDKYTRANAKVNLKIDEILLGLENANKLVADVPNVQDKLDVLLSQLNAITNATSDDTSLYTLFDIKSDFTKLNNAVGESSDTTNKDITSLKECFAELTDDISSISVRTNKLILSADDANKQFKIYLDDFNSSIQEFVEVKKEFNPEMKFVMLADKISEMGTILNDTLQTSQSINNAFVYLAQWIDETGNALNSIQNNIQDVQTELAKPDEQAIEQTEIIKTNFTQLIDKINGIEETFNTYKADDVSELKSLLTGIIVQLNTALTPDIDSLNEKIDKLSDENTTNFTKLETLLQEKINLQEKHIASLEDKVNTMENKFDKLIEILTEETTNNEVKDILNFLVSQISNTNELVSNQQNTTTLIENKISTINTDISEKFTSSMKAIKQVSEKVEKINENVNESIANISSKVDDVKVNVNDSINNISTKVDDVKANVNDSITSISTKVEDINTNVNGSISNILNKVEDINVGVNASINNIVERVESINLNVNNSINNISDKVENANKVFNEQISTSISTIDEVKAKIASFDTDINKIVSYIEED
jgi:chromosome segregation ATPase